MENNNHPLTLPVGTKIMPWKLSRTEQRWHREERHPHDHVVRIGVVVSAIVITLVILFGFLISHSI